MMADIIQIAGAVLLAAFLAQLLVLLVDARRRRSANRSQRENERIGFRERLALARLQLQKDEKHLSAWNGTRQFRIERKVRESDDVCSFYLRPQDQKPLPAYRAGQYLTFELEIPGHP